MSTFRELILNKQIEVLEQSKLKDLTKILLIESNVDYAKEVLIEAERRKIEVIHSESISDFVVKYAKHREEAKCLVVDAVHIPEMILRSLFHSVKEHPIVVSYNKNLPKDFKHSLSFSKKVSYVDKKFGIKSLLSKVMTEARQFQKETFLYYN